MSEIQELPVAKLIEDMAIYPRHVIDDVHVGNVLAALQAGVTLPPVIADQDSLRLVDGWHRVRAYRRLLGDEAVVKVLLVDYGGDQGAMLLAAIGFNASHGRKLDRIDQRRCVVLCEERQIPLPAVARVLNMPTERVERLRIHRASAEEPGPATVTGTTTVVLKRPLFHLTGRMLTPAQLVAVNSAPGTSYLLIVNQLVDGLREGIVNLQDEVLVQRLWALDDMLHQTLPERKVA